LCRMPYIGRGVVFNMARIFIADDNGMVRRSLRMLLSEHADWVICGEATDGREAIDMAVQLKPDLILLDVAMPILNGLHACVEILKSMPLVPIVLHTLYKTDQMAVEGKKAGARSVISKSENADILIHSIEELLLTATRVGPPPLSLDTQTPPTTPRMPEAIEEGVIAQGPPADQLKPPC
jgi:DNA-binding NarL/FixJ family response regulator